MVGNPLEETLWKALMVKMLFEGYSWWTHHTEVVYVKCSLNILKVTLDEFII